MKDLNDWSDIPMHLGPAAPQPVSAPSDPVTLFERGDHQPMGLAPVQAPGESDHHFHIRTAGTSDAVCTWINSLTPGLDGEEPCSVPAWLMPWQIATEDGEFIRMRAPYFR